MGRNGEIMQHLNLETCKLLESLGCESDADFAYEVGDLLPRERAIIDVTQAFTWDDVCTKENAVRIWGQDSRSIFQPYVRGLGDLLDMKLEGQDWEGELLKYLKAKSD